MSYSGLCIDGPMDGQRVINQSPALKVETIGEGRKITAEPIPFSYTPVATVTTQYRHFDHGGTGFWLLEGVGIEDAMKHMTDTIGLDALASRYEQIILRRKDDERHAR